MVFDFSQKLGEAWRGSKSAVKREILEAVTLNRTLTDASLGLAKRKPSDAIAQWSDLTDGRGDCHSFEPLGSVRPFISALAEPHVSVAVRIVGCCA